LTPIAGLSVQVDDHGQVQYLAITDDPQFQVTLEGQGDGLPAGWFMVETAMVVSAGEVARPCFYVDYGGGYAESSRIDLPTPDASGSIRAVVLLQSVPLSLRFDPSIQPVTFSMGAMRIRRISRVTAALHMLAGIKSRPDDLASPGRWAVAAEFIGNWLRHGRAASAKCLMQRYIASFGERTGSYQKWLALFEGRPSGGLLVSEGQVKNGPRISIVMTVCDPPLELLRKAIDSVLAQTYENWQLCIADDASSKQQVRQMLREAEQSDQRIQVCFRSSRGHMCHAGNSALGLVSGDYVGFLDHDDELHRDALGEIVHAIGEHPDARMFYTDEDKIDMAGVRSDPHFKPGWNPALLRAQNYICHFNVIQTALLAEVGAFRPGLEGAQDHDLVLRCSERLTSAQICHIPKVLYHWRTAPGSTAQGAGAKPYARAAGREAVAQHLQRIGVDASVEVLDNGHYRVRHRLPRPAPRVSIVIPTRDRADLLRTCVGSILERTRYDDYEVVIVDNGSEDREALELLDALASEPRIRILRKPIPFNFSRLVNHGVGASTGKFVCLLNNDTEVISEDWLQEMVAQAMMPETGVVGAMLYYPDDTVQHAGVVLGIGGVAGHVHSRLARGTGGYMARAGVVQNLSAVTGACLLVARDLYDQVGGFDDRLAVAFNDIDFCLRVAREGRYNAWTPFAELYHHESVSRGYEDTPEKQARFARETLLMRERWGALLDNDPHYNPNLSLESQMFELSFPPRASSRPRTEPPMMQLAQPKAVAG